MSDLSSNPAITALLDQTGAQMRAGLDAIGIAYTAQGVHAALHDQAPTIALSTVEQIVLLLPSDTGDEVEDQALFDAVMEATLASVKAILRRCFEEFGPVEEAAFAETWARSETALLDRFRSLAVTLATGGRA